MQLKNKGLFLDGDGAINKNFGYIFSAKNFILLKNVKKVIKYAYHKKYLINLYSFSFNALSNNFCLKVHLGCSIQIVQYGIE